MKLQLRLALPLFAVALLVTVAVAGGMVLLVRGTASAVLHQSGRQFQRIMENSLKVRAEELGEIASVFGMLEGNARERDLAWKHVPVDSLAVFRKADGKILSIKGIRPKHGQLKFSGGQLPSPPCLIETESGVGVAGFAPDRNSANGVAVVRILGAGFASELQGLLQADTAVLLQGKAVAETAPGSGGYPVDSVFQTLSGSAVTVRSFLPVEEVNAVRRRAVLLSAAGGVLLMGLVILFYFYTYSRVIRPIRGLTSAVDRMATGEIDAVVGENAPAELGVLISRFNTMSRTLNETQKQLVHAAKLSSVGQLVAGVSHELNNPLLALLGHAEHLATKFPEGDPARRKLDIVITEAGRMRRILANLRGFARQSGEEFSPVDLGAVAGEVVELIAHEAEKAAVKCLIANDGGAVVSASSDQMRQVVLNLALNALEAMPTGGILTVATGVSGENVAWVSVSDTGHGIAPGDLSRVTEPFFTTRPGKTGIGLSICQEIASRHGGRIRMESGVGKGTVVTLEIPSRVYPETPSPVRRERERLTGEGEG